jgi:retrograde regulation protein 2
LSSPAARTLPTVFYDRAAISLYDAQFRASSETSHASSDDDDHGGGDGHDRDQDGDLQLPDASGRYPLPNSIIEIVVDHLRRFKTVCEDFAVPEHNISVLATEATRVAPNASQLLSAIRDATGWEVRLLAKEEEGRIGAMGVASSFDAVEGLLMDLGGGSTQMTWMIARHGDVAIAPAGGISLPYGAAALTQRLARARKERTESETAIQEEIRRNFQNAYERLELPSTLQESAKRHGGLDLYLCGGGFRGWGYLLMSQSPVNPYPIPIINGFQADPSVFSDTVTVSNVATQATSPIFRVSKRRTSQVPAVAFLVQQLIHALPPVRCIHFCQGGVREGYLYDRLSSRERRQTPLLVATAPYAPPSAAAIADLFASSLPSEHAYQSQWHVPGSFSTTFLTGLTNLLFVHARVPRDSRPATALHSTTVGVLASTNSLSHRDRAMLALILYERWHGDLAEPDQALRDRLRQLVSGPEAWWCQYLGRVASLIGSVYPAGRVPPVETTPRIGFQAGWGKEVQKKKHEDEDVNITDVLVLDIRFSPALSTPAGPAWSESVDRILNLGKKKNWYPLDGTEGQGDKGEGYGVKIRLAGRFRGPESLDD